jgi:hypothetical protein
MMSPSALSRFPKAHYQGHDMIMKIWRHAVVRTCNRKRSQPGTSHVTFIRTGLEPVTVPAHKPVKPIYVRRFLALIDKIGEHHDA